jgi:ABC-type glutathione transport system ATPase component
MGEVTYSQVRQEVDRRFDSGEFRQAATSVRGPQMTTAAMLRTEREIIGILQKSNEQSRPMLLDSQNRVDVLSRHPELNDSQRRAVEDVSASFEKIVGIDGVAGAGKTTTLSVIREAAERDGYAMEGLRQHHARRRSWERPGSKPPLSRCTLRVEKSRIQARSGFTFWMSLLSPPRSRCTNS